MKILFLSENGQSLKKINLDRWFWIMSSLLLLAIIVFTLFFYALLKTNSKDLEQKASILGQVQSYDDLMAKASQLEYEIQNLKQSISTNKTQLISADLDSLSEAELLKSIEYSEKRLLRQESKFKISQNSWPDFSLEEVHTINKRDNVLKNKEGQTQYFKSVHSFSNPVEKGYISSSYGTRRDPFNGYKRHHNGIDIAAKKGSSIHAISSGFVTFTGQKGDFGKIIEIHHSNSLKSRYAHLDEITVRKGEVVRKGQVIAKMGQTGRATGPHLHLEVWEGEKPVNPTKYISTTLKKENKRSAF